MSKPNVKKRRKKLSTAPLSKIPKTLLSANRFSALYNKTHDANEEEEDDQSTANNTQHVTSDKPAPITVTGKCANDVKKLLDEAQIKDYMIEIISIGVKIQLKTKIDYMSIRTILPQKKIDHFTHKPRSDKPFKAVMYGLPKTDVNEVKSFFLDTLNINVIEVYEMKTKNADPNHAIYLVHFNRTDMSLAKLNKITAVNNTIVKWAAYSPKFKGPIQCRKCTMYGHGASNCNRRTVCAYCTTEEHESKDCPLNPSNRNGAPNAEAMYKCYTCTALKLPDKNHSAFDVACPARANYLAIRGKPKGNEAPNKQQGVRTKMYRAHRKCLYLKC